MTLPTETRRDGDVGDDEGYVKPSGLSSFSDAADGVNPHHPADDDFNSPEDPYGDEVDGLDSGIDYEFCIESQPSDDGDDELEHEKDHSGDFGPTQQRLLSKKELRRHERKQRRLQKKRDRKEEAKKKRRQATAASVAVAASSLGNPTTTCDGTTRAAYASVSEHFAHDNNVVDDDNNCNQQQKQRLGQHLREEQWKERIQHAMTDFEIAIDGSFGSVMTERERTSLAQQIRYCYSYNKRSVRPSLVTVTDLQDHDATNNNTSSLVSMSSSPSILQLLQREIGFEMWHQRAFTCTGLPLLSYYKDNPKRLVYLTSDATTTLHVLDSNTVYIIGGIVDRNRLKGATHKRATTELNLPTVKLPLDEYLSGMPTTKVLTVNHVFDILLRTKQYQQQLLLQQQAQDEEGMTDGYTCVKSDGCDRDGCNHHHHQHCRIIDESWKRAFQEVLPARKGAKFRG